MNKIIISGHLTKNPELRYTNTQKAVTTFTLAVDRPFLNKDGVKEADFIPVVVWEKTAIQAEIRFLTKKQYGKVVNRLTAQLMPDKKLKVIEMADYLINAFARGEHELLSPKEMESFLNEYIVYLDNGT